MGEGGERGSRKRQTKMNKWMYGGREGGRETMFLEHGGDEGRDDQRMWGRRLGRRHK